MSVNSIARLLTNLDQTVSPAIINSKTIWRDTADNIINHGLDDEVGLMVPLNDGSGLYKDRGYIMAADRLSIVPIDKMHYHDSDDQLGGGDYFKMVAYKNAGRFMDFGDLINPRIGKFYVDKGAAGNVVEEFTGGNLDLKLTSSTSTNGQANIIAGGGRVYFGLPIVLRIKQAVSTDSFISWYYGINRSLIQATALPQPQIALEGCSSDNANAKVYTGDNIVRSPEDLSGMVQVAPTGYLIEYYPVSHVYAEDGIGNFLTKTDNLPPIAAATNTDAVLRAGMKTQNTSAKEYKIWMMDAKMFHYDSISGQTGWVEGSN